MGAWRFERTHVVVIFHKQQENKWEVLRSAEIDSANVKQKEKQQMVNITVQIAFKILTELFKFNFELFNFDKTE